MIISDWYNDGLRGGRKINANLLLIIKYFQNVRN